jgi:hypothetical protein
MRDFVRELQRFSDHGGPSAKQFNGTLAEGKNRQRISAIAAHEAALNCTKL